MATSGQLIAVEGIDGSGKRTQVELLARALESRGHSVFRIAFPVYESWFGCMIAQFLNGDFGALESVDPRFTAMLYAGDRLEAKPKIESAFAAGSIVLADRYIASNLAHQTARVPFGERATFMAWIEHLEYTIYALPRESHAVYLRVPAHQAHALIAQKTARAYTSAQRDLQESSIRHLEEAAAIYETLAQRPNWTRVDCMDPATGSLRPPEEIARDVFAAVAPVLADFSRAVRQ